MKTPPADGMPSEGLELFIGAIVQCVFDQKPLTHIYQCATTAGSIFLPEMVAQAQDRDTAEAMLRLLAREICDRTPRPELRFATRKLDRPGRNDPCFCGSGRKYKQCCGPLEHANAFPDLNLLPHVLDYLPRKQWPLLADSAIDPDSVAATAHDMLEDGDATAAAALLQPWFSGTGGIAARHEFLLDMLIDAYTQLDKPRKKKQLLESALQRGDRTIRSSVLQRMATISADAGDFAGAWEYFRDAQREHADSASLSHLEITLLMSQGEVSQAQERARFWIAKLTRAGAEENRELIGFMRQVAEQGERAMFDMHSSAWPELDRLRNLLAQAPAAAVMHRLKGGDADNAGYIAPDAKLLKALKHWRQCFPQIAPGLTAMGVADHPAWEDAELWLACLQTHPLLWQSLDVLDDLVLALTAVPAFGIQQTLAEPLLARAEILFDRLIEAEGAQGKLLEWGWHENRPALRLLAHLIVPDLDRPGDRTVARIERMLALNPNDNHGFRSLLMTAYLQRRQFELADRLARRFEDDTELGFSQVLALWALGRTGDALQRLQRAHTQLPRLVPMLLAKSPRKPRIESGFVRYGGADQAWLFRERELPAWQALPGALDWLRQAKRALK